MKTWIAAMIVVTTFLGATMAESRDDQPICIIKEDKIICV